MIKLVQHISLALFFILAQSSFAQLAKDKCKYLGNIIASTIPANYNSYWNAVTSENDCKWGSIEGTRNTMRWIGADRAYNHAKTNGFKFRWHAFAWGSQYPAWIETLNPQEFKQELEEYIKLVSERYEQGKYFDQIDVINEQLGTHAPGTQFFREALGGTGTTGFDWQIWVFTTARKYFPATKLVLNDFGLENDQNAIRETLKLVKALKDRNLIDGFGTQAHQFNINTLTAAQLKSSLDLMATGGVPIYVTELDINTTAESDEATQAQRYQTLFPVYWEHPAVAGVSLWGYEIGKTWKLNTGLVNTNGTERAALVWLKSYMASSGANVSCAVTGISNDAALKLAQVDVFPNPFGSHVNLQGKVAFTYTIYDLSGTLMESEENLLETKAGLALQPGYYLLEVKSRNGTSVVKLTKHD